MIQGAWGPLRLSALVVKTPNPPLTAALQAYDNLGTIGEVTRWAGSRSDRQEAMHRRCAPVAIH